MVLTAFLILGDTWNLLSRIVGHLLEHLRPKGPFRQKGIGAVRNRYNV